jgi:hypothetical protein
VYQHWASWITGVVSWHPGWLCASSCASANGQLNQLPSVDDEWLANLQRTSDNSAELRTSGIETATAIRCSFINKSAVKINKESRLQRTVNFANLNNNHSLLTHFTYILQDSNPDDPVWERGGDRIHLTIYDAVYCYWKSADYIMLYKMLAYSEKRVQQHGKFWQFVIDSYGEPSKKTRETVFF